MSNLVNRKSVQSSSHFEISDIQHKDSINIGKNNLRSLILLKQEVVRLYMSKEINKAILLCGEAINNGLIGRTIKDNLDQIYCQLQSNSIMFDKDWYSEDTGDNVIYVSLLEKVNLLIKEVHLCLEFFDLLFDMFMVKNDKKSYLSFIISANRLLNNNSQINNGNLVEKKISKNNQKTKGVIAFRNDGQIKRKSLDGDSLYDSYSESVTTDTESEAGKLAGAKDVHNQEQQISVTATLEQRSNQSLSKWEKIYSDIIDVLKTRIPSEKDWQEKGIHYHEAIADISNDSVLILDGAIVVENSIDNVINTIKDSKVSVDYKLSKQAEKLLEVINKYGYRESCTWYKRLADDSQHSQHRRSGELHLSLPNADEIKERGEENNRDERLLLEVIRHTESGTWAEEELEYIGKNTSDFKNTFIRIDLNKLDIEESNAEGLLLLLSLMVKLMGYESETGVYNFNSNSDFSYASKEGENEDEKLFIESETEESYCDGG